MGNLGGLEVSSFVKSLMSLKSEVNDAPYSVHDRENGG